MKQLLMKLKRQKLGFLLILLGTLAVSILGNALAEKGVIKAGEGVIRAGQNVQCCPLFS